MPAASQTDARFKPNLIIQAWRWLCASRKNFPPNADIWHFRFHRAAILPELLARLEAGEYRLTPMQRIVRADGEECVIWPAADAFVLKLLTLALQDILPVHRACTHIKKHGGHKAAVLQTHRWLAGGAYTFVCKTDIRGYYASIDKQHLLARLARHVACPVMMDLLVQFMHYTVEFGGNFHTPRTGIPRGCPLSPLLAGFHLYELDRELTSRKGVRYLRFMDDLLILAQTRWQLKRAVAEMNRWFDDARLEQHPDKTFIRRIERGFDWLGYHLASRGVVALPANALVTMLERVRRLDEQTRASPEQAMQRVANYQRHYHRWVTGIINNRITICLWYNQVGYKSPWLIKILVGLAVM